MAHFCSCDFGGSGRGRWYNFWSLFECSPKCWLPTYQDSIDAAVAAVRHEDFARAETARVDASRATQAWTQPYVPKKNYYGT
eukprot:2734002-Amphidinium_carterae.1